MVNFMNTWDKIYFLQDKYLSHDDQKPLLSNADVAVKTMNCVAGREKYFVIKNNIYEGNIKVECWDSTSFGYGWEKQYLKLLENEIILKKLEILEED